MTVTNLGSYSTTGQQIVAHWTDVDADRLANAMTVLKLPGNYGLTDFSTDLTAVQTSVAEIEHLDNLFTLATGERDTLRSDVRDRVIELREAVNYRMKGSKYVRTLPDTPYPTISEEKLLKAIDDALSAWTLINAATNVENFTAPLLLRGGYSQANFQSDSTELRQAFVAVTTAENELRLGRGHRDDLLKAFLDRMVSYREAVNVEYGEEHLFTRTLPDVYESSGGSAGDETGVPAVPAAPTLTNGPDGQVVANWPDVLGAMSYRWFTQLVGTDLDFIDAGTGTISQATFSNLPIGAIFRLKIAAINAAGESLPGPHAEIVVT